MICIKWFSTKCKESLNKSITQFLFCIQAIQEGKAPAEPLSSNRHSTEFPPIIQKYRKMSIMLSGTALIYLPGKGEIEHFVRRMDR